MDWLQRLVARWRAGKETLEEAEADGAGATDEQEIEEMGKGRIRVKTSGNEEAERLVELMRAHGLASELRHPGGSEVEVGRPDTADEAVLVNATHRAVELWLLREDTPDTVDVRFGRQTVTVSRPEPGSHPAH
jgi:hypothetical protein